MKLVFIHGIAQANTTGEKLLADWTRDLIESGIDAAALAAANPVVAYYGDILSEGRGATDFRAIAQADEARFEFLRQVSKDMVNAALQASLGSLQAGVFLSQEQGFSQVAQGLIAPKIAIGADDPVSILDEVYDYLSKEGLRRRIDKEVAKSLGEQPMTIVAHSLGSLVAYRLLRDRNIPCRRLITLGSPLSFAVVKKLFGGDFSYPANLTDWRNFYDPLDFVCLGRAFSSSPEWKPRLRHAKVDNKEPFGHDADGYLRTPEVVKAVKEALAA